MKVNRVRLLLAFLIILCNRLAAQHDTSGKVQDSVSAAAMEAYNKKLAELANQQRHDSVRRVKLEAQISSLKEEDERKRDELRKQLRQLEEREAKRLVRKKAQIDSLRSFVKSYAVTGFFHDTLFYIYARSGSFSARDRAAAITKRISDLGDQRFHHDSMRILEGEATHDIVYGESIIASVSENDALWNNTSRPELAQRYWQVISETVLKYKSETSIVTLAREVALALFVLVIYGVFIYYTGVLFRWAGKRIREQEGKALRGIRIRNYTLFNAKTEVNAVLNLSVLLKWLVYIIETYVCLTIIFGIFPWTENFADTLFGYILNPVKKMLNAFWDYLPNFFAIAVIVFVFRYILKGFRYLKSEIERGHLNLPGFYPDWANPTYQIIRVIIIAFMIIVIFPYLPGSDSPVFRGVSVFLGFLFTFGSAGSLSNIVAGIVLTYMRLFRIGDRVKIGEVVGDVIEKSMLVTRVKTIKNEIISIPNSTVMNSHTVNYSIYAEGKGLIIHSTVTIGYSVPWREMHLALTDAALKTKHVLPDPPPFVLQTSLDDFYVSYQVNAYIHEANSQAEIYSDLHQNIQDTCNERGIEIMSPHYRAARDGNASAVPSGYLPPDYKAPGFGIDVSNK